MDKVGGVQSDRNGIVGLLLDVSRLAVKKNSSGTGDYMASISINERSTEIFKEETKVRVR
jgi:hypothetical protein